MENINLEDLDDQSLVELMNIIQGMDDELKNEIEGEENEES